MVILVQCSMVLTYWNRWTACLRSARKLNCRVYQNVSEDATNVIINQLGLHSAFSTVSEERGKKL